MTLVRRLKGPPAFPFGRPYPKIRQRRVARTASEQILQVVDYARSKLGKASLIPIPFAVPGTGVAVREQRDRLFSGRHVHPVAREARAEACRDHVVGYKLDSALEILDLRQFSLLSGRRGPPVPHRKLGVTFERVHSATG